VIEIRGGVMHLASELSRLLTKAKLPSPTADTPALPADPPPEVTPPNPLPWLKHPSQAIAGKVRAAGK